MLSAMKGINRMGDNSCGDPIKIKGSRGGVPEWVGFKLRPDIEKKLPWEELGNQHFRQRALHMQKPIITMPLFALELHTWGSIGQMPFS